MQTYQQGLLVFLLVGGSYSTALGQSREQLPNVPAPEEARQAISLDLAGNTPIIGVSYHHQIVRFATKHQPYAGALELSAGVGLVPQICFFGCSPATFTTHHALVVLWGTKLQGEFGYAGFLIGNRSQYNQNYLPGGLVGVRYSPKTWLIRAYMAGMIYQERGTGITDSGDLVWQKTTSLIPIPGLSIGKRF